MKYTIEGFSQEFALTLKKEIIIDGKTITRKIDCTDLVILRWFVDFFPHMKKVEIKGKQYALFSHKKLIEELPLIDITKKSFIDRMKKLVEFDILSYELIKEGGTFSLYGFSNNYIKLIDSNNKAITESSEIDTPYPEKHRVVGQTDTGYMVDNTPGSRSTVYGVVGQTDTKYSSIIDSSIIDSSIIERENKKEIKELKPNRVVSSWEDSHSIEFEEENKQEEIPMERFIKKWGLNALNTSPYEYAKLGGIDWDKLSEKIETSNFLKQQKSLTFFTKNYYAILEGYYDDYKKPNPQRPLSNNERIAQKIDEEKERKHKEWQQYEEEARKAKERQKRKL